jgi:hypothetical protein
MFVCVCVSMSVCVCIVDICMRVSFVSRLVIAASELHDASVVHTNTTLTSKTAHDASLTLH